MGRCRIRRWAALRAAADSGVGCGAILDLNSIDDWLRTWKWKI